MLGAADRAASRAVHIARNCAIGAAQQSHSSPRLSPQPGVQFRAAATAPGRRRSSEHSDGAALTLQPHVPCFAATLLPPLPLNLFAGPLRPSSQTSCPPQLAPTALQRRVQSTRTPAPCSIAPAWREPAAGSSIAHSQSLHSACPAAAPSAHPQRNTQEERQPWDTPASSTPWGNPSESARAAAPAAQGPSAAAQKPGKAPSTAVGVATGAGVAGSRVKRNRRADRGPLALYEQRRDEGAYRDDPRQHAALELLQDVYDAFEQRYPKQKRPSGLTMMDNVATSGSRDNWWESIFANTDDKIEHAATSASQQPLQGLYMYGGVGVGKTMLMDLLVESSPREFKLTRIHFHDFMLDVHSQLAKQKHQSDPLVRVADSIRSKTRLLALDEFFVTDVADAMILTRLFGRLWDRGLTLIATSNRPPADLYAGGLQRQLFMPFIHQLEKVCTVHNMESVTDHRRLATHTIGAYFVRLVEGHTNDDRLEYTVAQLTQGADMAPRKVQVAMGRTLTVPRAADRTCIFTFDELCGQAVGAADYIALMQEFHTIALNNAANRSMAYRFVTLVDVAYEHKVKLIIAAEGYPAALFENVLTYADSKAARTKVGKGGKSDAVVVDDNLGFAKDRTVSRLVEMSTMEYAVMHAEHNAPELLLALQEAQGKAHGK